MKQQGHLSGPRLSRSLGGSNFRSVVGEVLDEPAEPLAAVLAVGDGIFRREELNNVLPDWRDVTVAEIL